MCVDSCGRRFDRAFSMKSCRIDQELFGKVTLREFETRTLNPEHAAHFIVKHQIGMQCNKRFNL